MYVKTNAITCINAEINKICIKIFYNILKIIFLKLTLVGENTCVSNSKIIT